MIPGKQPSLCVWNRASDQRQSLGTELMLRGSGSGTKDQERQSMGTEFSHSNRKFTDWPLLHDTCGEVES
jgi:hypothetical protein